MTQKEYPYAVLYHESEGWTFDAIFQTIEEAKERLAKEKTEREKRKGKVNQ